jgi:hypothetical protein
VAILALDAEDNVLLVRQYRHPAERVLLEIPAGTLDVDPATGEIEDFARNAGGGSGQAARLGTDGLERPIDVRFDPSGRALYVVDFGVLRMNDTGPEPQPGTGALWRITREEDSHAHP